jgi:excisionase family DNA binding protein
MLDKKAVAARWSCSILLTKQDLAARWNCSISKIDKMIKAGELVPTYIGRLVRFRLDYIEEFEKNHVGKFVGTTHSPGRVPACIDEGAPIENTRTYVSGNNGTR